MLNATFNNISVISWWLEWQHSYKCPTVQLHIMLKLHVVQGHNDFIYLQWPGQSTQFFLKWYITTLCLGMNIAMTYILVLIRLFVGHDHDQILTFLLAWTYKLNLKKDQWWRLVHHGNICSLDKDKDNGVQCHFQQYFIYIMMVSFIGGGNRRKPLTCRKSLTNFII